MRHLGDAFERACGLPAVQGGQRQVHQDQVRGLGLDPLEGLAAVHDVTTAAEMAGAVQGALDAGCDWLIMAAAVALLMIGGEFDLSIGSIVGAAGMTLTILAVDFGLPIWP